MILSIKYKFNKQKLIYNFLNLFCENKNKTNFVIIKYCFFILKFIFYAVALYKFYNIIKY